jgi:hypothetical protein
MPYAGRWAKQKGMRVYIDELFTDESVISIDLNFLCGQLNIAVVRLNGLKVTTTDF